MRPSPRGEGAVAYATVIEVLTICRTSSGRCSMRLNKVSEPGSMRADDWHSGPSFVSTPAHLLVLDGGVEPFRIDSCPALRRRLCARRLDDGLGRQQIDGHRGSGWSALRLMPIA